MAQGHGWHDAVVSAVTLAAAALPEEFPVVFAGFLGVGVYRLARRQALVRRAVSVENLGRVSCICTDKTGTVTEGRLRLSTRLPAPELGSLGLSALLIQLPLPAMALRLAPLHAGDWQVALAGGALAAVASLAAEPRGVRRAPAR